MAGFEPANPKEKNILPAELVLSNGRTSAFDHFATYATGATAPS
jgi:hypothetical protein